MKVRDARAYKSVCVCGILRHIFHIQVIKIRQPKDRGGPAKFAGRVEGQCWTSAAGCPMCAEEPVLPSLLLVHLAEPAKKTDTDERALSQSCGGSALKLSAFAVQRHDAGLRAT